MAKHMFTSEYKRSLGKLFIQIFIYNQQEKRNFDFYV